MSKFWPNFGKYNRILVLVFLYKIYTSNIEMNPGNAIAPANV